MMGKKKYGAIDIAKYVSALLVVCIHTFPFYEVSVRLNAYWIQTVCRLAVPFFFVSSGFFFFRKWDKNHPEANQETLSRYEKRLGKIYLIWTIIYLPYTIWDYTRAGFRFYHIFAYLRDLLLNGSYYHLWFLPALMLSTWLVAKIYQRRGLKKVLSVSLILYIIGYLINVYQPVWESIPYVSFLFSFFTKLLVTARNGIFFGPIFVGMGLLLARSHRLSHRASLIGWAVSFVGLFLEVTIYMHFDLLRDLTSMYLMLVPAVYFMMNALLTSSIPYKESYLTLRHESLLIYTSHILFAKVFLMLWPHAHIVVYFLTLAFAQCFASLVMKYRKQFPILENLL